MVNGWTGGQYSVVRAVLGVWLAVAAGISAGGAPGSALLAVGLVFAVMVAAGYHDRPAALGVAVVLILLAGSGVNTTTAWHTAGWMGVPVVICVLHSLTVPGPYGSALAWTRADPGGGWRMPRMVFAAFWIVLAFLYLSAGICFSLGEKWHLGTALFPAGSGLPTPVARVLTWALFASYLAFGPVCLVSWFRKWAWVWLVVVNSVVWSLAGFWPLAVSLGLFHLLVFDPAWIPGKAVTVSGEKEAVFYDGHCGLCHWWARFLLAEDAGGDRFLLSPLQGNYIKQQLSGPQRAALPDSIVVLTADGQVLTESRAVLYMLARLGGLWGVLGAAVSVIPRPIRDVAYRSVARVRGRLFGMPTQLCPMMPAKLSQRFRT